MRSYEELFSGRLERGRFGLERFGERDPPDIGAGEGSSMQIELLDRKRWWTRLELSNAVFDYIEIFHNRQRRHSSLDYVSSIEFEASQRQQQTARFQD